MRVVVMEDYQRAVEGLDAFRLLDGHVVVVHSARPHDLDERAAQIGDAEALVLIRERTPVDEALLARLPSLRLICQTGRGIPHLDLDACTRRGIVVSFTELRGTYRKATSELTWGLIFAVARHIPHEATRMREGGWQSTIGITLAERTLGLVGLGRQGKHVLPVAKALGMKVIAWSPNLTDERAAEAGVKRVSKEELFSTSDVVSIHLVLGERTRNIIGAPDFARMKPTAILVNTARGGLIDEPALIETLKQGRIDRKSTRLNSSH